MLTNELRAYRGNVNTSVDPDSGAGFEALNVEDLPTSLVIGADEVAAISADHDGPVEVYGSLTIEGTLSGPLTVESLGRVTISGDVDGPIEVRVAANVVILPSGRVAGTITNHGSVVNHGWRSGRVEGRAPEDADGSTVAAPLHGIDRFPTLPPR